MKKLLLATVTSGLLLASTNILAANSGTITIEDTRIDKTHFVNLGVEIYTSETKVGPDAARCYMTGLSENQLPWRLSFGLGTPHCSNPPETNPVRIVAISWSAADKGGTVNNTMVDGQTCNFLAKLYSTPNPENPVAMHVIKN